MNVDIRQEEFFFGPEDSALFGAVHLPADGRARRAVLICNSIAKEQADVCRGLRLLGDELALHGCLVMRFDYAGVGDSAGAQVCPYSLARWCESIGHAVDHLTAFGFDSVTAIGLRLGSLLLEEVLPDESRIDRVVYWDPVGRGRNFIREQQALYRLSVGAGESTDEVDIPLIGATLSSRAADDIGRIELRGAGEHVVSRLLAVRPESTDKRVRALGERPDVEVLEVDGMAEFVTPASFLVALPIAAINDIVAWVVAGDDEPFRQVEMTGRRTSMTTGVPTGNGHATTLVEERIEHIGEQRMFAIRTLPVGIDAHPDHLRTVVFFATANDSHVGPNREWVDLARQVAASGGQAIRFDRTGAGESGPVSSALTAIYSNEAINEAVIAVRHASPDPRGVLVTGVCSGSWYSAYVARELRTGAVVLINAIAWSWRRKRSAEGNVRPEDLGVPRSDPEWQKTPRARVKNRLRRHLPYPLWRELGRRGITQIPEVLLRPLIEAGVETTLVLSPHDHDWYTDQRGPEGIARIDPGLGAPRLIAVGSGDHTAFHESVRSAVRTPILEWVTST